MRLAARPVLLLTILAGAVHAGAAVAVWRADGGMDALALASLDCEEYVRIAGNLAVHGSFSASAETPLRPDTWRTPGYPLFLTVPTALFGGSTVGLVLFQQVVAVLSVILIFLVARRWMDPGRALVVSVVFLVEPYRLYYSFWLLATTLFVALLLLTWLIWQRAWSTRRWEWFGASGALAGLLILTRPVAALIPLALLIGAIIECVRSRSTRRKKMSKPLSWSAPVAFAAVALVVVGSWMTRNKVVAGHFALSHQGGVVLAYFKATEVRLWREGRAADRYLETTLDRRKADMPHTIWDDIDRRLRERFSELPEARRAMLNWQNLAQGNKTDVEPFAVSSALAAIGWSELAEAPIQTVTCYLVRSAALLTFPMNLSIARPRGVEPKRVRHAALGAGYLVLCAVLLYRLFRMHLTLEQAFFPLACAVSLLMATTPQLDPRFRVPMIPLLLIVAFLPLRARESGVS